MASMLMTLSRFPVVSLPTDGLDARYWTLLPVERLYARFLTDRIAAFTLLYAWSRDASFLLKISRLVFSRVSLPYQLLSPTTGSTRQRNNNRKYFSSILLNR